MGRPDNHSVGNKRGGSDECDSGEPISHIRDCFDEHRNMFDILSSRIAEEFGALDKAEEERAKSPHLYDSVDG